jgi:hypothetical protein
MAKDHKCIEYTTMMSTFNGTDFCVRPLTSSDDESSGDDQLADIIIPQILLYDLFFTMLLVPPSSDTSTLTTDPSGTLTPHEVLLAYCLSVANVTQERQAPNALASTSWTQAFSPSCNCPQVCQWNSTTSGCI